MIDAYEIGIQLLLQDDVSAGLTVINRGLAEVDRAIAATSASLAGLVQEGNRATKAIAAAAGTTPPATLREALPHAAPEATQKEDRTPSAPDDQHIVQQAAAASGAPPFGPDAPVAPAAVSAAAPPAEVEPPAAAATTAPAPRERSSAPEPDRTVGRSSDAKADTPATAPAVKPEQSAPADAATLPTARDTSSGQIPSAPVGRPAGATASHATVTASVRHSGAAPAATRSREAAAHPSVHRGHEERRRAVAPWSGVDHQAGSGETMRMSERATAAPQPAREATSGGGGTVMLDGRLVGQWLTDHMAGQASRPPGGTSFFDPRQTPAWTVGGVL